MEPMGDYKATGPLGVAIVSQEVDGTWDVYFSGDHHGSYPSKEQAVKLARRLAGIPLGSEEMAE